MKMFAPRVLLAIVACTFTVGVSAQEPAKLQQRVEAATGILHELATVPDKGIPDNIAKKAHCVIVIPSLKREPFWGASSMGRDWRPAMSRTGGGVHRPLCG